MERQRKNTELKLFGCLLSVTWIGETGRHVDSYDEMDGGLDYALKLVKDQMANDTWLPDANVAPAYPQSAI